MKLFSFLFLVAAISSAYGQVNVRSISPEVNSASNDLSRHKRWDLDDFIMQRRLSNQKQNVNSAVNPAMDDIKNAIAKAKSEGRNADNCLEPARLQLRDASETAYSEIDHCHSISSSEIEAINCYQTPIYSDVSAARTNANNCIKKAV